MKPADQIGEVVLRAARNVLLLALLGALVACTTHDRVYTDPRSYRERAERQDNDGITVHASALSVSESKSVFGVPLNNFGVQPVWISIENRTAEPHWIFPVSVDADYFPAYEVATRVSALEDVRREDLYRLLARRQLALFVHPYVTTEGFLYTHSDEGMKAFVVELRGARSSHTFDYVAPVPGLPSDYYDVDPDAIHDGLEVADLDHDGLLAWLESIECCPTNAEDLPGDPLNIVFVGTLDQVRGALIAREWDVTAPVTGASLWRMTTAFLFGSRYRYAPISPLYLFDRDHDLAFQKARAVIDERNHMRLWLAPVTLDGVPVWIGQVSRDVGVKFSGRLWPPTTHVVDPDMDDARFYVLQDILEHGRVHSVGFAKGHEAASLDEPHRNAEDDPYFTDGFRVAIFLADDRVPVSEIKLLDWRLPPEMAPYRANYILQDDPDLVSP